MVCVWEKEESHSIDLHEWQDTRRPRNVDWLLSAFLVHRQQANERMSRVRAFLTSVNSAKSCRERHRFASLVQFPVIVCWTKSASRVWVSLFLSHGALLDDLCFDCFDGGLFNLRIRSWAVVIYLDSLLGLVWLLLKGNAIPPNPLLGIWFSKFLRPFDDNFLNLSTMFNSRASFYFEDFVELKLPCLVFQFVGGLWLTFQFFHAVQLPLTLFEYLLNIFGRRSIPREDFRTFAWFTYISNICWGQVCIGCYLSAPRQYFRCFGGFTYFSTVSRPTLYVVFKVRWLWVAFRRRGKIFHVFGCFACFFKTLGTNVVVSCNFIDFYRFFDPR